jgi:hypothetical protein
MPLLGLPNQLPDAFHAARRSERDRRRPVAMSPRSLRAHQRPWRPRPGKASDIRCRGSNNSVKIAGTLLGECAYSLAACAQPRCRRHCSCCWRYSAQVKRVNGQNTTASTAPATTNAFPPTCRSRKRPRSRYVDRSKSKHDQSTIKARAANDHRYEPIIDSSRA